MNVITKIEELLTISGNKIGFFGGSFNPPNFEHLDFIKKAVNLKKLDQIIVCTQSEGNAIEIEELTHRMRIMDLMLETTEAPNICILSPEVCNGIESQIFIDDVFYLLKRRQKEVYVLIGCDSFQQCADAFKSLDVIFIIGCRVKRSDVQKQLIAENMKCIFIDDIIPCKAGQLAYDNPKHGIYLSAELQKYILENPSPEFKENCNNCN